MCHSKKHAPPPKTGQKVHINNVTNHLKSIPNLLLLSQIIAYGSTTLLKVLGKYETVIESKTTNAVSAIHILAG